MIRTAPGIGLLVCLALACPAGVMPCARADEPARWTLDLQVRGARVQGMPLGWTDDEVQLLLRDGRLMRFAPGDAADYRKSSGTFRSYSSGEVRAALSRELGGRFEVSGTGHYLVAHPHGQRDYWSPRFEALYRSFVHYVSVRGLRPREPEFPLVAMVFENQQDFLRYAHGEGAAIGGGVVGYYSQESNRVSLFDLGGGSANEQNWHEHADTIIHEATHQMAFNTGVHRRFSDCPIWVAEGLATMFEAPGVWNARQFTERKERINRGRLDQFRHDLQRRAAGRLAEFVSTDGMFVHNVGAAYAEAWALSFFLCETRPRQYTQYLALIAKQSAFAEYPASERLADFTSVFGADLRMLESRFLRFIEEL